MMDNLQEAYAAYQQALYYLPDPKVSAPLDTLRLTLTSSRSQNFGMVSAFCTTATAL